MERINPSSSAIQNQISKLWMKKTPEVGIGHSLSMKPQTLQKAKYILPVLSLSLSSVISPTTSAFGSTKEKKAACRIEIDNPHISKSILLTEDRLAVKVNARSICNFFQTRFELTVKLYQVGLFRDYFRDESSTRPNLISSNGFTVHNRDTKWYCSSKKNSAFYGIAYSTAVINGQTFVTKPVRSRKTVRLACGI